MSCAKTAEPTEMPFGIWTRVGPRKHVLGRGAHWGHLVNTTEPSMCGGDAACCKITLTTCLMMTTMMMMMIAVKLCPTSKMWSQCMSNYDLPRLKRVFPLLPLSLIHI